MASKNTIIDNCKKYLGKPYVWGAESMSEGGYDCSGYAYNVMKDSGMKVSRTTANGFRSIGKKVNLNEKAESDLLFFGENDNAYHIAFYAGNGMMYESIGDSKNTKYNPGKGVVLSKVRITDLMEVRRIADDISSSSTTTNITSSKISEPMTEKEIWDALMKEFKNVYGVSGLMGNLKAESNVRSINLQQTYEKKLGFTDESYTKAVDDGSYTNFVRDSAGYGLAQWTYWSRKEKLLNYANSINHSIGSPKMQVEFLIKELKGYTVVYNTLKNAKSVREASDIVLLQYERPADQSETVQIKRAKYGEEFYNKYAVKETPTKQPSSSSPSTSTTTNVIVAGKEIYLNNTKCYTASTSTTHYGVKTGTFYLWDGVVKCGKIRITNAKSRVGIQGQVTCWVYVADLGLASSNTTTSTIVSKPVTTPTTIAAGTKFTLSNTPVYNSESGATIGNRTGVWYAWEDEKVGQKRIRMTNRTDRVGVKGQVSFFVDVATLNDIKKE